MIIAAVGLFCLGYTATITAQVTGLSYTLSPSVEYTWWNDQAGLADGYLIGGKFGFGFGEYLELRANYMQSYNLTTDFGGFGFDNYDAEAFDAQDIDLRRMGGELRANLSSGKLLPFVTVGTGIQSIEFAEVEDAMKNEQIYVSAGAGLVLSLADRYTLLLEAKNTQYRFNAGQNLLTDDNRAALDLLNAEFEQERLGNWSASASIQFYLGGRRPGTLSELDKAYFRSLGGGFSGLKGTIEPIVGQLDFNEALPYRDTWLAGGSAGIDFGSFLELRGFYLQALEEDEFTQFDQLATYGGELRMKLNTSNGIVPYLIVGGGNIDVNEDEYAGRTMEMNGVDTTLTADDSGYAMGGAGLVLPISQNLKIFGSARALLTSGADLEDLQQPDQLNTSWLYSAGFRLSFGKKATSPDAVLSTQIDDALKAQQAVNDSNADQLKQKYEARVVELERQLNEAYVEQDVQKAAILAREKQNAEQVVDELNRREAAALSRGVAIPSTSSVNLTPAELENLIDEILDGTGNNTRSNNVAPAAVVPAPNGTDRTEAMLRQRELERRLNEIEKLLIQLNERQSAQEKLGSEQIRSEFRDMNSRLNIELERVNRGLQETRQELRRLQFNNNTNGGNSMNNGNGVGLGTDMMIEEEVTITEGFITNRANEEIITTYIEDRGTLSAQDSLNDGNPLKRLKYQGMAPFAGLNIGGNTTANLGFRWFYDIGDSPVQFVPETFFGFGSPANFGISANFLLPFSVGKTAPIRPYLGAGVGFMQIGDEGDDRLKGAFNIILGTNLKVGNRGRLFADITGRNIFKYNQVVVGYRLPF